MTAFDVVLLAIGVPMFLLRVVGYLNGLTHPLVKAGLAEATVKSYHVLFWFAVLMLVLYRMVG